MYRERPAPLVSVIATRCTKDGRRIRLSDLKSAIHQPDEQIIVLAEMEGSLLNSLGQDELKSIQRLTISASSILWITCGGLLSGRRPEFALASGLARSLRSENASLDFVTVDTNPGTTTDDRLAEIVVNIASGRVGGGGVRNGETEYLVDHGSVFISRLVPSQKCNDKAVNQDKLNSVLLAADAALAGTIRSGNIVFQDDQRRQKPMKSDHVEVKIIAAGLNKEVGSECFPKSTSNC